LFIVRSLENHGVLISRSSMSSGEIEAKKPRCLREFSCEKTYWVD
jgi:hypothetical protein